MGITVTFTLVDAQGRETKKEYATDLTVLADIITAANALAVDLEAASGCGVSKFAVNSVTAVTPTIDAGSNVDEGCTVTLLLVDGRSYPFKIPAPAKTAGVFDYITGGTVDIADTQVTDLVANFLAAGDFQVGRDGVVSTIVRGTLDRD